MDLSRATSAVFRANMAVEGGGAIYGDESSTSFSANEYNHSLAENRFGFCFIFFGNEGQPIGTTSQVRGMLVGVVSSDRRCLPPYRLQAESCLKTILHSMMASLCQHTA